LFNKFLHPALIVETPKSIRMDVWWLGLVHRTLQLLVFVFLFATMLTQGGWAHTETPMGSVNAYVGGTGKAFTTEISNFNRGTKPKYCNNNNYVFAAQKPPYFWNYQVPECEALDWQEFTVKDPTGAIIVQTTYIEQNHYGWRCAGSTTATASGPSWANTCSSSSMVKEGEQCKCFTARTVTPVGAEKVDVAFGHSFQTSELVAGGLFGSNNQKDTTFINYHTTPEGEPTGEKLVQRLLYANFTEGVRSTWKLVEGSTGGTLEELIRDAAGIEDGLEHRNKKLGATDYRDETVVPYLRTAGLSLVVDIKYTNMLYDPETGARAQDVPSANTHAIGVDIRVRPDMGRYAGPGQEVFYTRYPYKDGSASVYHKVTRYAQGAVITFQATGTIYWFDFNAFLNNMVALVVLAGFVGNITRFIGLNLVPAGVSTMLKNQGQETAEQQRQMGMIGIRMILAGIQYKRMDSDNSGTLGPADLFSVLASLGDAMSFEKAYSMSHLILGVADKKGTSSLDFEEYFSAMEPLLSFQQYVKAVPLVKDMEGKADYDEMKAVWDTVQNSEAVTNLKKKRQMKRQATRGVAEPSQVVIA
jgi:hypothetical protein